jgi:nucleoside 2-deoxyribosyltransferase
MSQEELFAFVVMPFDKKYGDLYKFGIKDTAEKLSIRAERLDEQIYQEGMLDRIYRQIEQADIIVADMSEKNANVFYEVGYAHAKGKHCILLTTSADDIPFDLKHRRHIVHNGSATTLSKLLKAELESTRKEIDSIRNSRIKVTFKEPSGYVRNTEHTSQVEIDLSITLTNDTTLPSPHIEAAYLYTSAKWEFTQNGQRCPHAVRDGNSKKRQHFLTVPVPRLQPGAWAPLHLRGTRLMGTSWMGDELKDTYHLTGDIGLCLVTSSGNFTHTEFLDIQADDIPF